MKFDLLSFHSPCRATHSTTVIILTHPRLLQITVPKGRKHTSKGKKEKQPVALPRKIDSNISVLQSHLGNGSPEATLATRL